MNMIPIWIGTTPTVDGKGGEPILSTPFELFYDCKPDLWTLFPFGSVGFFKWYNDGTHERTTFKAQSYPGIALGRSDCSNGLLFWSPETMRFNVSADYRIDTAKQVRSLFPGLLPDGGLELKLCSHGTMATPPHHMGSTVYFHLPGPVEEEGLTRPIGEGTVVSVPILGEQDNYIIEMENHEQITLSPDEVWGEEDVIGGTEFGNIDPTDGDPLHPKVPAWMKSGTKIALERNGQRNLGYLDFDDNDVWCFALRDQRGRLVAEHSLPDLPILWQQYIMEGQLQLVGTLR